MGFKESNYTYWGYVINYKDGTTEFFNIPNLTYDELCSLELERGKEISYIDVVYGDTGSITINYNLIKPDGSKELLKSDYSYGLFSANLPGKIELIGLSTNLDQLIENYIIVSQDEEAPFYYEENKDKVINISLRNPQYTIHFTDELGNKIRESEKISAKVGEIFEYRAPTIEGYLVKVNDTISEMYLKEDKEFTIIYQKLEDPVEEGKVIVKYEDNSGKTISESTTLTGKVGESYKLKEKEISGYKLIKVKGEPEGVYSQSPKEIIYVYQKITEKNTEKENVSLEKNTPKEQNNFSKLPKTGETYIQNSMISILGLTILGGIVLLFNKKDKNS